MIWENVVEDKKVTIVRFLDGLNYDIMNVVELQYYMELRDMMHIT
jgi:hypothetical protein